MFGLSWSEILIIGVVALVLIGPNDLPRAMKTAARWMAAGRKLAREFQGHVDDLVREAELDELREQARKLAAQPLSSHIQNVIDPNRELAEALAPPVELHGSFPHNLMSPPPPASPALVESPADPMIAPPAASTEPLNAVPDPSAPTSAPQA
jgi:sec-independent protein translocase protein TatB